MVGERTAESNTSLHLVKHRLAKGISVDDTWRCTVIQVEATDGAIFSAIQNRSTSQSVQIVRFRTVPSSKWAAIEGVVV